ncbi:MAG: c-type cytochrome [Myxococcota bacterium]
MIRAIGLSLLLAAFIGSTGCGPSDPAPAPSEGSTPPKAEAPTPAPPAPAPPPAPAEPEPAEVATATWECLPGSAEAGAGPYGTLCESCHGPGGNGEGPAAAGLNPKPVRHTDGPYMNALSNEHIRTVIRDGGPAVGKSPLMAPWGGALSDVQLDDVVAYVRSLAQPPYACP